MFVGEVGRISQIGGGVNAPISDPWDDPTKYDDFIISGPGAWGFHGLTQQPLKKRWADLRGQCWSLQGSSWARATRSGASSTLKLGALISWDFTSKTMGCYKTKKTG